MAALPRPSLPPFVVIEPCGDSGEFAITRPTEIADQDSTHETAEIAALVAWARFRKLCPNWAAYLDALPTRTRARKGDA